jgi:hypothetical protein
MAKSSARDPFEVVGKIPDKLAYQWCSLKITGSAEAAEPQLLQWKRGGWKPVPASRHPRMRHVKNRIIVNDQLLMQKPKALVQQELEADKKAALAQFDQNKLNPNRYPDPEGRWSALSPAINVTAWTKDQFDRSKEKLPVSADDRTYCSVTIGILVSDRDIENSLWLNLDVAEYMRRRIIMDTSVLMRHPFASTDQPAVFGRAELEIRPLGKDRP